VTIERFRILTAILLRHPILLHDVEHAYVGLDLPPALEVLRTALHEWAETAEILDSHALVTHLTNSGLQAEADQVLATVPVPLPACAASAAMPAEAATGWWHIFGFLNGSAGRGNCTGRGRLRAGPDTRSQNRCSR
jgi:DNA primase